MWILHGFERKFREYSVLYLNPAKPEENEKINTSLVTDEPLEGEETEEELETEETEDEFEEEFEEEFDDMEGDEE